MALNELEQLKLERLRREKTRRSQQQPQDVSASPSPDSPNIERQNIIGQVFNVPGATSRAAIQQQPALAAAGPFAGIVGLSGIGGQEAQQAAARGATQPSQVPTFQEQAIGGAQKAVVGQLSKLSPEFLGSSPGKILSFMSAAGAGAIPSAAGLVADIASSPIDVLLSLVTGGIKPGAPKTVSSVVDKSFLSSIKPLVKGKKTIGRLKKVREEARSSVESIVSNKQNLKFIDDAGDIKKGALPETLDEFSQAIDQTKKSIFLKYDAIKTQAGEKGSRISLKPVAEEILEAVSRPQISDVSPTVQNYGIELAARLDKRSSYSLTEAQDVLEALNANLKGFFINPTPDAAHKAIIDRAVANNIRKSLVQVVEKETGPGFSILKKQYGALNAIEEDVTKKALFESKKNLAGLGNLFDIFSAGDIVSGITMSNPTQVAKGGFQLAARKVLQKINNPNRIITNMFKRVDKIKNIDPVKRLIQNMLLRQAPKTAVGSTRVLQDQ